MFQFRFSTSADKLWIILGLVCACAHGSAMPIMIIVFGNMSDSFIDSGTIVRLLDEWMPTWVERCENITAGITSTTADPCVNVTTDYIMEDPNPPTRFV
jgi:hypothetical protein